MSGYASLRRDVGCRHIQNPPLLRSSVSFSLSRAGVAPRSAASRARQRCRWVVPRVPSESEVHRPSGSAFLPLNHNTELLVDMVRQQFKRHKHETAPWKMNN